MHANLKDDPDDNVFEVHPDGARNSRKNLFDNSDKYSSSFKKLIETTRQQTDSTVTPGMKIILSLAGFYINWC